MIVFAYSTVILLLMNLQDQLSILAVASSLSMATNHAFFTFTKTPYDPTTQSIIGLSPNVLNQPMFLNDTLTSHINIFESVFVIGFSFPEKKNMSRPSSETNRSKRHINIHDQTSVNTNSFLFKRSRQDGSNLNSKIVDSFDKYDDYNIDNEAEVTNNNHILKHPSSVKIIDLKNENTFNFLKSLQKNTPIESEILSQNTFVPKSSSQDRSFLAQAPLTSTQFDDVFRKSKDASPIEELEIEDNNRSFNLLNTVSKLTSWAHSKVRDQRKYITKTLFFESEHFKVSNSKDEQYEANNNVISNLVLNIRSKRDIENYVTTEADLDALYDSVFILAYAVHLQAKQSNTVPFSNDLISSIVNLTIPGYSGDFKIDIGQQVNFDFFLYDFNATSGAMESRIFYKATSSESWELKTEQPLMWPGGVELVPDECFKLEPGCNNGLKLSIIAGLVVCGICLIAVIIVATVLIRRHWVTKEMTKGPNKVILCSQDLVFVLRKEVGKSSRIMKSRVTLLDKDSAPDLIRGSDPNRSLGSINELSDFTETARYNGDLVHVKELNIKGFEMRSKLLTFIKMCRDLRHENLNPYVGFLADVTRPSIVMEYCSRGSLHDIIHNEDFKLDWDFKLSLLTDLVRGIRYLHASPLKYHGHMTSRCCVIDSRFVLKITDYGVSGIMEKCKAVKVFQAKDMLWSAPELLRDESLIQRGTETGDIYAMSIIFQEVALRTEPYSTTGLTPEEIVKKLKKPPPLIRPSVTPQAGPPLFIQIMKQCWAETPEMRPGLDEIYDQFKKLTGGKKANIVDTMFKMLEKYSIDLEDIVAERTMQLEEEKKKTDQLLFRMLPSTVAESLKLGRNVEAEFFDGVTIYFSDIVGFTTISAMSTPMQVVDLLNDLYSMFDATINNHDVYKVETIGDAYMVVSGLPIRNGKRHAGEIGTLALVLLSQCGQFTIRHMPQVPLRLRIGLHSGSCVAGVVGLTMPRFCLFGDTVNTASRMESSGAAFRVHISEACKLVLDELGGYITEYRGQTELKGKGLYNTYWLTGKEGFDQNLPEPPPLNGNNTHGLDSILGDLKLDLSTGLDLPKTDIISKSNSAPNLASPLKAQKLTNPKPSSKEVSTTNSQPDNLHEIHRHRKSKTITTSIVTADISIVPCGTTNELNYSTSNQNNGTSTEAANGTCQSRHSESNDSGFGSERKHSEGNDGYSTNWTTYGEEKINTDDVRQHQSINRTSGTSSSNVSSRKNYLPTTDFGDDLTTVTEV